MLPGGAAAVKHGRNLWSDSGAGGSGLLLNRPAASIPVCRPLLPPAASISRYIERIDESRRYANFAPLVLELKRRLAEAKGLQETQLAVVSSGTQALMLALRLLAPNGGLCMVPSWTFAATPGAAHWAGLTPWFVDIDRDAWALTPALAREALRSAPGPVSAVVPVSPFGAAVPCPEWDDFRDATGIPVVIDAAAAWDALEPGRAPAVVSLHATKALGVGEAGVVVSTDAALIAQVEERGNFGLYGSRISQSIGINGKLAEHTAAVGLAALDEWPTRRLRWIDNACRYRAGIGDLVTFPPGFAEHAVATCVVQNPWTTAEELGRELEAAGIGTLRWWQEACHRHPAFAGMPRLPAPESERAAAMTLGLPMTPDLSIADIDYVVDAVRIVLGADR
ncbi:MAG: DegT/DnrJ/EryC1/StrS family aminotransferase [Thalassobaculum sp.]|uniref:DegT/DnrJ/EryC1/StrS family aminotransferase n=1 Tax=Thalassobaculum sp. TaxID=2022740 RepID=UPI0032EF827C